MMATGINVDSNSNGMKNVIMVMTVVWMVILTSCQNSSTADKTGQSQPGSDQFAGSWVQPNPINDKEVQGFVLNKDGTAQSINMETLKYRKWWMESGKLVLVMESIGNRVSSVDTVKYEVVTNDGKQLKLKDRDAVEEYRKQ